MRLRVYAAGILQARIAFFGDVRLKLTQYAELAVALALLLYALHVGFGAPQVVKR